MPTIYLASALLIPFKTTAVHESVHVFEICFKHNTWIRAWPPSAVGTESDCESRAFQLCCFNFSAVLVVGISFPFGVMGRMWNSTRSVPDHCLFIYFTILMGFEPVRVFSS